VACEVDLQKVTEALGKQRAESQRLRVLVQQLQSTIGSKVADLQEINTQYTKLVDAHIALQQAYTELNLKDQAGEAALDIEDFVFEKGTTRNAALNG